MAFIGLSNGTCSALVSFCFMSRFHFVRGIGDILVCPKLQSSQEFSAKVVKLLAKQGPIYIRAVQDIGSWKHTPYEYCQKWENIHFSTNISLTRQVYFLVVTYTF